MSNVVVIGSQWGDEGKGKVVDWLASRADVVVRFQGGHNAGHTLVVDGVAYKLSLLPSGVVRGTPSIIGNGVVVDPWALLNEIKTVSQQGVTITPDILMIADNCPLILPLHSVLDKAVEEAAGKGRIGTTGRGIGPAYEDKIARRAIRMCDLADAPTLDSKIDRLLTYHNTLLKGLGHTPIDPQEVRSMLYDIAPQVLPYVRPVWRTLDNYRRQGKRILFEGAQGALLDVDHGTYPFVTSSNTLAGQALVGSGVGVGSIKYVLGITKAYSTRVGEGPFPTELHDTQGERLGTRGREFGTVTARKRRCGWFDAVAVRQSVTIGGITGIVLTKLDVLDGFDTLKICTKYRLDGQEIDYLPTSTSEQARVQPVYEEVPGWHESTEGARSFADLPALAVKYVRRIEELVGAPLALLSTSPERDDTILLHDPFVD